MADLVNYRLERVADEVEELSKISLFSKDDLTAITNNRKKHEYNLHRRQPKKLDFLAYIAYEISLEKLLVARLKNARAKGNNKKLKMPKVRYSILSRIDYLYQRLLNKFKGDEKLWVQYLDWCKEMNCTKKLGRGILQALELHPKNVDLWISGAKWQLEHNGSAAASRALFQKGLRFNPKSEKLWIEYFKMELQFAKSVFELMQADREREENSNKEEFHENLIIPIHVFDEAVLKKIPDKIQFVLDFLEVTINSNLKSNKQLLDHIRNHLEKHFSDNPHSIFTICTIKLKDPVITTTSKEYPFILKEVIDNFLSKINFVNTSCHRSTFLSMVISYLIDIKNNHFEENLLEFLTRKINTFCKMSLDMKVPLTPETTRMVKNHIDPLDYNNLVCLSLESGETSPDVWIERMDSVNENETAFQQIFESALKCLHSNSHRALIWKKHFSRLMALPYDSNLILTSEHEHDEKYSSDNDDDDDDSHPFISVTTSNEKINREPLYVRDKFMQFANEFIPLNVLDTVINEIIESYVEFFLINNGKEALYNLYDVLVAKFKILPPVFYNTYTQALLKNFPNDPNVICHIRNLFSSAVSFVESSSIINYERNVQIWISFMKFELIDMKDRQKTLEILLRARINLKSSQFHLSTLENHYSQLLKST